MLITERRWVHSEGTVANANCGIQKLTLCGMHDNELMSCTTRCQGVSQSKGQLSSEVNPGVGRKQVLVNIDKIEAKSLIHCVIVDPMLLGHLRPRKQPPVGRLEDTTSVQGGQREASNTKKLKSKKKNNIFSSRWVFLP